MTPTAENSVLQISGVVSGKLNITCSAMAQRLSLKFSMADVRDATGMPLSVDAAQLCPIEAPH
jgi:hypothetical protein